MADLAVTNLSFSYDRTRVLKDIDFKIKSGELVGIIGPNGSGKTTLLRCITNTLPFSEGTITLDGVNIRSYTTRDIAKHIAVVPQGGSIEFGFSVKEIVLMGRHPHQGKFTFETKEDFQIVESSMKITRVEKFKDKMVQQLSGGEFQRVLIARALAQRPEILLLDEPTTHLDISHQLEIMDIMSSLNSEKGITILGVFHDLNLAARYCRRLLMIHRGRLVADGSLEDVLTPANLSRVFNINSIVRRNPITNNLFIDPISTLAAVRSSRITYGLDVENGISQAGKEQKIKSKPKLKKIHIICGAGTGSSLMKKLVDEDLAITAGVLNVLDQDHQSAEALKIPTVSEAAFSPISKKSHKMNLELVDNADVVILTDVPFGTANRLNLQAVEHAAEKGKPVIIYEPRKKHDINKRDFTQGWATKKYKELYSSSKIVHSLENLVKILTRSK
ncbi:MAG: ABC transporter ATP-binding protein [Thermoplasmata archaeon]|nr:MAG: ABC transporter ATP-binding protein [Thermoplasmata archaeon]